MNWCGQGRRRAVVWAVLYACLGVGTTDEWWGSKPKFGSAASTVSVLEGETAKLPCVVLHLNDRAVTWLRRRDLHILTAGQHTYSADQRFQVVHVGGSQEWTLVVRYAQPRDAGVYECQVNTDPKMSRPVTLTVTDPNPELAVPKTKVFVANNTASTKDGGLRVEIQGPRELYIEEGSSLSLTCLVTSSAEPSTLVYWYHDTNLIDYNSPRGGVNLKIDRGRGETTTQLVVSSVGPGDSGMYSCVPQGSHPASVLVHVQKGEHEAAIQQSGVSGASRSPFLPHLPVISSVLLPYTLPSVSSHLLLASCVLACLFLLSSSFVTHILYFSSYVEQVFLLPFYLPPLPFLSSFLSSLLALCVAACLLVMALCRGPRQETRAPETPVTLLGPRASPPHTR